MVLFIFILFCYRYKSLCCVIRPSADLYIFHPDVQVDTSKLALGLSYRPCDERASLPGSRCRITSSRFFGLHATETSEKRLPDGPLGSTADFTRKVGTLLSQLFSFLQLENLMSDIGGQLGLWIGVSAITVAEVLKLLLDIIKVLFRKRCVKDVVEVKDINMVPFKNLETCCSPALNDTRK